MKIAVYDITPRGYARFYRGRLKQHGRQELLAGSGIAVGVALVFAVLVANTSITASAEQLIRGTTGSANYQLSARSNAGFPSEIARQAARLPGVRAAAPALRIRVLLVGPRGRQAVQLVGVTSEVAKLDGSLTRNFGGSGLDLPVGMALPSDVADAIGGRKETSIKVIVNGSVRSSKVGAVLGESEIGALSQSLVAVAYLPVAQRLAGSEGKVTQVLVDALPGREDEVRAGLEGIAGGRLTVAPVDSELRLLRDAARPNNQSTSLFAAIGGAVGFLLAFSAMLLTVPERRRQIADLREQGYFRSQVLAILLFEALALGLLASMAGLLIGDILSRTVLQDEPGYLALGFPIGTQRIVEPLTVALALAGGLAAAVIASALPALDLFTGQDLKAAIPGRGQSSVDAVSLRSRRRMLIIGLAATATVALAAAVVPVSTVAGGMVLAIAAVLVLPSVFAGTIAPLERFTKRRRGTSLRFAAVELKDVPIRSVALAAVTAVAVYGSVAVGGARQDLEGGLVEGLGQYLSTADLWVTTGSDGFQAESFQPSATVAAEIAAAPEVTSVRTYQGQYLDIGDRRIWVIARPSADRPMIPPSQVLEGDLDQATARLARGTRWITVSNTIASAHDLEVGDAYSLPTPTGQLPTRVAAVTTNLGWGPGAVILNARDYRRAWRTSRAVALEVDLAEGVPPAAGRRAVARVLGPDSGLRVETSGERLDYVHGIMSQGLARLKQIATLLLVAAGLAVAFAMAGALWQRRWRLADLKVEGFHIWQLWRALLLETSIIIFIGCATGALFGVFGHFLAGRWLALTTGFPAPFSAGDTGALLGIALVAGIGVGFTAISGYRATRVPAHAAFQE